MTHRDQWTWLIDYGVPRNETDCLLNSYLICTSGRGVLGQMNRSVT